MIDKLRWKHLAGKQCLGEMEVCDWGKRKVPFVSRAEKVTECDEGLIPADGL